MDLGDNFLTLIDALVQRVEKLAQTVPTKRNPFELDVVATKESLEKLKRTFFNKSYPRYKARECCPFLCLKREVPLGIVVFCRNPPVQRHILSLLGRLF